MLIACAKASPTSRSITSENGGGSVISEPSAVRARVRVSSGMLQLYLSCRNNYNYSLKGPKAQSRKPAGNDHGERAKGTSARQTRANTRVIGRPMAERPR